MRLWGSIITLRLVNVADAEFILGLRLNEELSRYLSKTDPSVEKQRDWIARYKMRERSADEYYFMIEGKNGAPYGTVRIYNIESEVCTWGSWILVQNRPEGASVESACLTYDFAFRDLKKQKIILDVKKGNDQAIFLYEKFGFLRTWETPDSYHYELMRERYEDRRNALLEKADVIEEGLKP